MTKQLDVIAKGAGFVIIGMVASKLFSYLWRLIIAHISSEVYGTFSLGLAVVGILAPVALIGLNSGVLRFVSFFYGKGDKSKIKGVIKSGLKTTLFSSVVIGILIFLSADWIAINIFNEPNLIIVLKLMAFAFPFLILSEILIPSIRALQKIQYKVFSKDIMDTVFRISLTGLVVFLGYGLFGITVAYVFSVFLTFVLLIILLEFKVFSIFRAKIKTVFINRELFRYSLPLMLSAIISKQVFWIDSILIGFFMRSSDVGIYNTAVPTASLLIILPSAILSLFLPVITAEYAKENKEVIKHVYLTVTKWVTLSGIPLFLIFFLFSEPILLILFGLEYVKSAMALSILALGWFIFSICWTSSYILNMIKKTRLIFFIELSGFVIMFIIIYLLVPIYGITGAAVGTFSSLTIIGILYLFFSYRNIKIFPFDKRILKIFVFALFGICFIYLITYYIGLRLLIRGITFLILSGIYIYLLFKYKLVGKEEMKIFRKGMKKIGL